MDALKSKLLKIPGDFSPHSTLWIAYSGGVDSTVLLHVAASVFLPQGFCVKAIHVNHGLSPNANGWAEHCQETASALPIPLVIEKISDKPSAGDSVEAWAREKRREIFKQVLKPGDILLTAHHAQDQAETVLLQAFRGAGVKGLAAMAPFAQFGAGFKWRPFLSVEKSEIQAYAQTHSLKWIEDESNAHARFDRNFLRHEIMPLLQKRWPGVTKTLGRVAQNCAEATLDLRLRGDDKFSLRTWIHAKTGKIPSRAQLEEIQLHVLEAKADATPCVKIGEYEVRRYQGQLYAIKTESLSVNLPVLTPEFLQSQGINIESLDWFEVRVRFREGGERAKPKGRGHSQCLKKLFQEYQVPPWQRDTIPLVFYKDQLIMAMGVFVCEI